MCLGIPGKIVEITDGGTLRMGKIDYGGVIKEACLAYVPEAVLGEYVIVHAGFALNTLTPEEAEETLKTFRELDAFSAGEDSLTA
jgi:hydrogenase expression/formation protein HypC